jgi:hypothetical protein
MHGPADEATHRAPASSPVSHRDEAVPLRMLGAMVLWLGLMIPLAMGGAINVALRM